MRKTILICTMIVLFPVTVFAENRQVQPIWDAMRIDEFVELFSAEGMGEADALDQSLFEGEGGELWRSDLMRLYDPERMGGLLRNAFSQQIERRDIAKAIEFYQSPLGRKATDHELSSRKDLIDPEIEEASKAFVNQLRRDNDPKLDLVEQYIVANGLIENNIVGTMNGNYAFLLTLAEAGQGRYAGDTSSILGEVWSQEPDIRARTEEWAYSYFAYAYRDLSEAELRVLIDFSETDAGQHLNAALFASFDAMFSGVSKDLATLTAKFLAGEEL